MKIKFLFLISLLCLLLISSCTNINNNTNNDDTNDEIIVDDNIDDVVNDDTTEEDNNIENNIIEDNINKVPDIDYRAKLVHLAYSQVGIYEGKDAITHVHVEERFKEHTLVSCRLETGRTHQIRVHMRYINHPIVGDPEYGKRHQKFSCSGQMLHAYKLTFIHPTTKKEMTFTCPRDSEFESILEQAKNLK